MSPLTKKRCTKCKEEKELSLFYKDKSHPTGYHWGCKSCMNEHRRNWLSNIKINAPEKHLENLERRKRYNDNWNPTQYGITIEKFNDMVKDQNNLCKICLKPETAFNVSGKKRRLAIDHCHKTGKVRGLLCGKCNNGIGNLKDSIEILERTIMYLKGEL